MGSLVSTRYSKSNKIKLDSKEFNSKLNVYAQNSNEGKLEAVKVLSPAVQEKILKLSENFTTGEYLQYYLKNIVWCLYLMIIYFKNFTQI